MLALQNTSNAKQCWLADDASGDGFIKDTLKWCKSLEEMGSMFGNHQNTIKYWLIVKPKKYEEAMEAFQNAGINLTTEGRRHLFWCWLGIERLPRRLCQQQGKTMGRRGYQAFRIRKLTITSLLCRLDIWIKTSLDLFHVHVARYPRNIMPSRRRINVQFYTIYNRA